MLTQRRVAAGDEMVIMPSWCGDAAGGTALIRHPAGPGCVSLRAGATDSAGDSVTQTVVRAHRLRAAA